MASARGANDSGPIIVSYRLPVTDPPKRIAALRREMPEPGVLVGGSV